MELLIGKLLFVLHVVSINSARAVDPKLSWFIQNGLMVTPYEIALKNAMSKNLRITDVCSGDTKQLIEQKARNTSWAVTMLRATGEIKYGQNEHWVGDFDLCHSIDTAQYCASIAGLGPTKRLAATVFGTCLPISCSANDTQTIANDVLRQFGFNKTLTTTCKRTKPAYTAYDKQTTYIFAPPSFWLKILAGLIVVATIADSFHRYVVNLRLGGKNSDDGSQTVEQTSDAEKGNDVGENRKRPKSAADRTIDIQIMPYLFQFFGAFSLYANISKLFSLEASASSLHCVNGLRIIGILWIIYGHTLGGAYDALLAVNARWYHGQTWTWFFQPATTFTVSVDLFFFLSAVLISYSFMLKIDKVNGDPGKYDWLKYYVHRFWRLTPAYMLLLAVTTNLSRYFGDGPIYPDYWGFNPNCRDTWITHLTYMDNFLANDTLVCCGWTWFLAANMQFYWVSPIVLVAFCWKEAFGVLVASVPIFAHISYFAYISTVQHWQVGQKVKNFGHDYYLKPWYHLGPHFCGLIVGFIMARTNGKHIAFNRVFIIIGWIIGIACIYWPVFGLHGSYNGHRMSQTMTNLYYSCHNTVFAIGLGWVIFACQNGYGGVVNSFLSWRGFLPLGRLSYCAYLVHPIVILYGGLTLRTPVYLNYTSFMSLLVATTVFSFITAAILSLCMEMPSAALEPGISKIFALVFLPAFRCLSAVSPFPRFTSYAKARLSNLWTYSRSAVPWQRLKQQNA
ncbi:nose resistant to fluoxetine protein 6-like [Tubulanus polymorphus]|uniref:nose resistant to fluoxetine protein 6-like n=1 Tax=Tubulanus polymorphus TaxID=672921 RepID=UPI003DA637A8